MDVHEGRAARGSAHLQGLGSTGERRDLSSARVEPSRRSWTRRDGNGQDDPARVVLPKRLVQVEHLLLRGSSADCTRVFVYERLAGHQEGTCMVWQKLQVERVPIGRSDLDEHLVCCLRDRQPAINERGHLNWHHQRTAQAAALGAYRSSVRHSAVRQTCSPALARTAAGVSAREVRRCGWWRGQRVQSY